MEKMLPKEGTIIDLGCGYGIFTNFIAAAGPKRKIIAMEFNKDKIKEAKKGFPNVSYFTGDITKAKVNQADAIILMHVLHHLDSYRQQEEFLTKVVNKLKKGGTLLIDEVFNEPPWKRYFGRLVDWLLYPFQPVYYRFRPEMIKLLKKYPLKLTKIENVDGHLAPFAQIVYLCQKV
jgi:ubiquinone/menaquinone biosynthesis C-methylase UbiE